MTPYGTSAIIFDSCPGEGTLEVAKKLLADPLPAPAAAVVKFALFLVWMLGPLSRSIENGVPKSWTEMRKALNSGQLLPWVTAQTPRLYIYSETDHFIPAKEIEDHAADARAAGLDAWLLKFDESVHVSHARKDPQQYWGAVENVWKKALDLSTGKKNGAGFQSKL